MDSPVLKFHLFFHHPVCASDIFTILVAGHAWQTTISDLTYKQLAMHGLFYKVLYLSCF